ncbi:lytic transglycosylase domain-containing protein [Sulfurimonas sp.]|uniref:lytic transglycosylase domain-containing protein n=1 Tax=Sulfurimonas sp. TaxID=2022749 RepID=UPI002AB025EB|nr:LysM peptidoglycan-binding domain-containing protein [Sulfurimonas sp.]
MIRYFLLLLLPIFLSASLTFSVNHNKEVALLESFDIEPSFIYDPIMNKMRNKKTSIHKDKHFFKAMDDAYTFIPAIKRILTEHNVPAEFLYLAMAESNFSTRAYSKKRASGLWQFMPKTGKRYGLKIDEYVDERRDLIKSTEAAAKYLTHLHKRFGKWYLAAIAYNCGGGRLSKAIKRAKSDELSILLNPRKKYIPRESRFYIRKIIALAMVGQDEEFLMNSEYEHLLNRANAYSISTIKLPSGESLRRVSKIVGIPLSELKKLNRHLKYDFVPPYSKTYDVYIPYVKLSEFKKKYHPEPIQNIYKIHVVRSGDNLSTIGRRYGVSYRVIMDFNKLKHSRLRLKQKLIIPIDSRKKLKRVNTRHYYMVKKGDTLESISKAYRVSIASLKNQNHLKSSLIRVGDRLKVNE